MFLVIVAAGALLWLLILILPWQSWRTRESLDAPVEFSLKTDLSDVTVLIPARNEEKHISRTLSAVMDQGINQKVIVIDDESTDDTAAIVNQHPGLRDVSLLSGKAIPDGWNGKLWSLQQGLEQVDTPLVLLLDADMELGFGFLAVLREQINSKNADMVSVMASLRMLCFWEGLFMPAFVFFFKLLYPFKLSNSDSRHVAAAAGGCVLIRTEVLRQVGGFENIRNELIDDCALARTVKNSGFRTWTGLTHSAQSVREYNTLSSIWNMVARTAFTQLRYSLGWLLLCTVLMFIGFVAPVFAVFSDHGLVQVLGIVAWILMMVCYVPTLVYYGLAPIMSFFLPVVGLMFLAMTWTSAIRHWTGNGASWKGRNYFSSDKTPAKQ
ncbi:MAG: glycosyltransferase [Gammaproteobacteria bacterium]|nr:glycosyltransferase [Gammaproteobacteria bacterium]